MGAATPMEASVVISSRYWGLSKHDGIEGPGQGTSMSRARIGWAAPLGEFRARLEISACHGQLGFLGIFLRPGGKRITVPGRFQVERRQRQRLPAGQRFFHEILPRQRYRQIRMFAASI